MNILFSTSTLASRAGFGPGFMGTPMQVPPKDPRTAPGQPILARKTRRVGGRFKLRHILGAATAQTQANPSEIRRSPYSPRLAGGSADVSRGRLITVTP